MRVSSRLKSPRWRGENDAIVTEAQPRLLLHHSRYRPQGLFIPRLRKWQQETEEVVIPSLLHYVEPTLAGVVPRLMKTADIPGYFTNHSLRVTATTRLYDAQVDKATIMEQGGHRSTDGVRAYKRSSEKLKELSSNVLNRCEKKARSEKTTCK